MTLRWFNRLRRLEKSQRQKHEGGVLFLRMKSPGVWESSASALARAPQAGDYAMFPQTIPPELWDEARKIHMDTFFMPGWENGDAKPKGEKSCN